jgi:hypothetical protein
VDWQPVTLNRSSPADYVAEVRRPAVRHVAGVLDLGRGAVQSADD